MPDQGTDFARMALQTPPAAYDQTYMRTLVGSIERLLRSRVGRGEAVYWGVPFTRVTGTDATFAVAATTDTVVEFDTLESNGDSLITFDGATFTFTSAPVADLQFQVSIRNDGTLGAVRLALRANGTTIVAASDQTLFAGGDTISATFIVHAAAGDDFDIVIFAANAMNLDLTASSCYVMRLSVDPRMTAR